MAIHEQLWLRTFSGYFWLYCKAICQRCADSPSHYLPASTPTGEDSSTICSKRRGWCRFWLNLHQKLMINQSPLVLFHHASPHKLDPRWYRIRVRLVAVGEDALKARIHSMPWRRYCEMQLELLGMVIWCYLLNIVSSSQDFPSQGSLKLGTVVVGWNPWETAQGLVMSSVNLTSLYECMSVL